MSFWGKAQHKNCDKALRENAFKCGRCFNSNFGERLASRRCYYCSTDAFWWGDWGTVNGRLACETCVRSRHQSPKPSLDRAFAIYRGHSQIYGAARSRQQEVYYEIVDFKDSPKEFGYLVDPLGNALSSAIRQLVSREQISKGAILAAAPSSEPSRKHMQLLVHRAAASLDGLQPMPLLLSNSKGSGAQKERGLSLRKATTEHAARVSDGVAGHDVIIADDIITTGSTLEGCAAALKAAGASRVYGAAIVRVINPPRTRSLFHRGKIFFGSQFVVAAEDGRVVLPKAKPSLAWVEFLCGRCSRILRFAGLELPSSAERYTQVCACGQETALDLTVHGNALRIESPERRGSELICHVR